MIDVEKLSDNQFKVTVSNGSTTTHTVTVSDDYYQRLTGGSVPPETLVERSFEFLLERESNTSILSAFKLPVIGKYFPEYEDTIKQKLG